MRCHWWSRCNSRPRASTACSTRSRELSTTASGELVARNSQWIGLRCHEGLKHLAGRVHLIRTSIRRRSIGPRSRPANDCLVARDRRLSAGRARRAAPTPIVEAEKSGDARPAITQGSAQKLNVAPGDRALLAGPRYGAFYSLSRVLVGSGPISKARVVLAPLPVATRIAQIPGPTRVLLRVKQGKEGEVASALQRTLGSTVTVRPVSYEAGLFDQATSLSHRSTSLFGIVSIILGVLLVYSAIYLAVIERRREIAELRLAGAPASSHRPDDRP